MPHNAKPCCILTPSHFSPGLLSNRLKVSRRLIESGLRYVSRHYRICWSSAVGQLQLR